MFFSGFWVSLFSTLPTNYCRIRKQFQSGSLEPNSRIPLFKEKGPQQAQKQMDRLHARHQPYQPADLYPLPDHPGH